jgi:hypothetical protein
MCPSKATRPATACGEPARDVDLAAKLLNDKVKDTLSINTQAKRLANFAGGRWLGHHGVARCPVCLRQNNLTIENGKHRVLVSCAGGCDRRVIINVFRTRGGCHD